MSARGVSTDAADLILHSWRTKTNSNYNSARQKWAQWCDNRAHNPFSAPIASFLGFLAHQFALGRVYRSLNVYRSAVSSTHLPVDGFPLKQHPLVTRLLKGVFNLKPPRPKYSSVWMSLASLAKQSVPGKARGMDPLCVSQMKDSAQSGA